MFYEIRGKRRNLHQDYLKVIKTDTWGITRLGQRLLQESCQAYVYCVLGAQARTHWRIVGSLGNSYQTQQVFRELLKEVLAQDKLITLIQSMRIAIKDTRVRLDFCLSPGLELLPSQMIFIQDSPGYNNTLIVSSSKQNFGVNSDVNQTLKKHQNVSHTDLSPMHPPDVKPPVKPPVNTPEKSSKESMSYLEIGAISIAIVVVGRLFWVHL